MQAKHHFRENQVYESLLDIDSFETDLQSNGAMVKSLLVAEVDAIILGGRFGLFCHQFYSVANISSPTSLCHQYHFNLDLIWVSDPNFRLSVY